MDRKPSVLFLCHRIPYPPNKGDKIRSFNLLRWLTSRYDVHLGAFVDCAEDWSHTERLDAICASTHFLPLTKGAAKALRIGQALVRGRAISVELYRNSDMAAWVEKLMASARPSHILVFSSAMGLYIDNLALDRTQLLVDFVDVDSEKWRQYSVEKRWPVSWLFERESRLLLKHDRALAGVADKSYFVSEKEAELFRTLVPSEKHSISALCNGVDTRFFDPAVVHESPFPTSGLNLVFTGAMDYWPNVDAVGWFCKKVMPILRDGPHDVTFFIVGANPNAAVRSLAGPDVVVTGTVDDIRPYIGGADMIVAPLRVARGIQNKVLEAMAMGKVVITTSAGAEGIEAESGQHYYVLDDAEQIAGAISDIAGNGAGDMGARARNLVIERYGWANCLSILAEQMTSKAGVNAEVT